LAPAGGLTGNGPAFRVGLPRCGFRRTRRLSGRLPGAGGPAPGSQAGFGRGAGFLHGGLGAEAAFRAGPAHGYRGAAQAGLRAGLAKRPYGWLLATPRGDLSGLPTVRRPFRESREREGFGAVPVGPGDCRERAGSGGGGGRTFLGLRREPRAYPREAVEARAAPEVRTRRQRGWRVMPEGQGETPPERLSRAPGPGAEG
jgi:hypothetical protein